ncbi:hypothetical protein KCP78_05120 [Salmonella enterica subsp. enterica]|nr:hypothetical protein KCP78_05120 [Salmonella enterica subsp. enterica]
MPESLKVIGERPENSSYLSLSQLSQAMLRSDQTSARQTQICDSGSIEQDADSIIMLYREAVYDEHSPQHHLQVNLSPAEKQV